MIFSSNLFFQSKAITNPQKSNEEVEALKKDLELWINEDYEEEIKTAEEKDLRLGINKDEKTKSAEEGDKKFKNYRKKLAANEIVQAFKCNSKELDLSCYGLTSLPPHLLHFTKLNSIDLTGNERLRNEENQISIYINPEYKAYQPHLMRPYINPSQKKSKSSYENPIIIYSDRDIDTIKIVNYKTANENRKESNPGFIKGYLDQNLKKVNKTVDITAIKEVLKNSTDEESTVEQLKSLELTRRNGKYLSTLELNNLSNNDLINEIQLSDPDNNANEKQLNAERMRELINDTKLSPPTTLTNFKKTVLNLFQKNNKIHPKENSQSI